MEIDRPNGDATNLTDTTFTLTGLELHKLLREYAAQALTAKGIERPSIVDMVAAYDNGPAWAAEAQARLDAHAAVASLVTAKRFVKAL